MLDRQHARSLVTLTAVLALLTCYRVWVIVQNQLPLYQDEAQYWVWSLTPHWGYYSKPPMVAWIIRLFSGFGESELAVRLGTLLLHPLSALLVYALGYRMFGARIALWAALLFITLPLVAFNSLFMTTDAPLFFFWALALYGVWRALERNGWGDWMLAGAAAGLGLMSKYSMAVFAVSVATALCLPAYRRHRSNPRLYLAALLALLIFLPNLWWNAQRDFVSFRHVAEISQLGRELFHPAMLGEFVAGQFACMGPVPFAFLIAALASPSTWHDPRLGFLAAFTLPFLAVVAVQAWLARANANWAAPAYVGGSVLVAACWARHDSWRWWICAIVLNLLLASGFYHYRMLAKAIGVTLTHTTDPYARVLGWPQMGKAIGAILLRHPDARLAVAGRGEFALLNYYVQPHPDRMRIWNPQGGIRNHFDLVADMKAGDGVNFIVASPQPIDRAPAAFERWTALGTADVPLYPGHGLRLYVYRGERFRGYAPW